MSFIFMVMLISFDWEKYGNANKINKNLITLHPKPYRTKKKFEKRIK